LAKITVLSVCVCVTVLSHLKPYLPSDCIGGGGEAETLCSGRQSDKVDCSRYFRKS